jgi:NADPH2:quinone reductase
MVHVIECSSYGPVEDLRLVEREPVPLDPAQLRIAVSACGVNFVDGLFVQGRYQIKPQVPFVPGMEAVGRIVEIGEGVAAEGFAVGDRVLANTGLGGYASEVVVGAAQLVRLPDALSDGQAATFMQSYLTGWFALHERARAQPGQTMLVLGAGSGVGLAAVDLGAAAGLRVIAAASTEAKRALALDRGATAALDTSNLGAEQVKAAAREFASATGRGGVDLLYDPVGGELGEHCLRALGEDGQYLVIGFAAGIGQLAANQVLLRNRRITGVDWGAWATRHPAANSELLGRVLEQISAGALNPVEPVAYPLEAASTALADLAARRVAGKAVLVP